MKTIHSLESHAIIMNNGEYATLKCHLKLAMFGWAKKGKAEQFKQLANLIDNIEKGELI